MIRGDPISTVRLLLGQLSYARFDSHSGQGVTNGFDALGRANSANLTLDGSWTIGSTYDIAGNRTHVTHPDGVYFQMGYDVLGRMSAAWWHSPAGGYVLHSGYQYDAQGRRSTLGRANSASYYRYDAAGRLSGQLQAFAQNSAANNVLDSFGYNPASQLAAQTRNNDDYAWLRHYNNSRSYTANGLGQYTAAGGASFAHDANGNMITESVPGANGTTVTTRYYYDVENRLVAAYRPEGTLVAALKYDPLGRLYEVSNGTANGTTRFVHDGVNIALEYNTAGSVLRRYFWGTEADEPIIWDEGAAMNCTNTRFLLRDRLGSVVAGADCSGARTFVNRYDEYGIPALGNSGRFQYTGQAWIAELGMYYYKARMYSPTLGRFMQTDQIGYGDGLNWYDYVGGDPVNATDPTGMTGGCNEPVCPDDIVVPAPRIAPPKFRPESLFPGMINAFAAGPRHLLPSMFVDIAEVGLPQSVASKVGCEIGNAFDAGKFAAGVPGKALDMAGDYVESALNQAHDLVFPPACGGPCGLPGQARAALANKEFRRWFHQVYKQQQGIPGGGRNNPDMTPEEIMDAYHEWQDNQFKFKPKKC